VYVDAVLIAVGDAATTELEREALSRSGTIVHTVGSVRDALLALQANTFSAVLLDYGLPDGDPWLIVEAAHAQVPRVPVVLLTPTGSERIPAQTIQHGATENTVKGGSFWDRLPSLVQRVVERAREDERERHVVERFRLVAQHTSDVIATFDFDGRYTYVSPSIRKAFGEEPEELLGRTVLELMHPVDRAALEQARREGGLASGESALFEIRRRRKDGSYVWVETQLTVLRDPVTQQPREIMSIARDVSERRAANEGLQRERERLAEAQRLAQLGSWEWDIAANRASCSAEFGRIFGLGEATFAPSYENYFESVHPDDRVRADGHIRKALQDNQSFHFECRVVRPTGEVRFIHARGKVFTDEHGRACRMTGTVQDITERKELDRRVVIADRMASVGTLAAGVAHEINNPLTYVIANLDFLALALRERADALPTADTREFVDAIAEARDGAERVRKIVRGLRTFSRAEDERRQVLILQRVIAVSIDLAFNEVRHRARLVKDFAATPPVYADEARLAQVVVNLIVNAAQAIPEGMADRNEIRIRTRTGPGGEAIVEVHDTGTGIPEHLRVRVFDPFFTTKAVGAGMGLGLSICHGIVSSLGGELSFECPEGRGTVFRMVLPAATAEVAPQASTAAPCVLASGRKGRVLIVDDDEFVMKTLKRALDREHEIITAGGGRQALDRLSGGEDVDVILCDLMMPDMTGMDLYAELLARSPAQAQRLVFMSGGTFTERGKVFLDEVPNQRFEKPFDIGTVRALVRNFVR